MCNESATVVGSGLQNFGITRMYYKSTFLNEPDSAAIATQVVVVATSTWVAATTTIVAGPS
jgi:hypothetical protein